MKWRIENIKKKKIQKGTKRKQQTEENAKRSYSCLCNLAILHWERKVI